jgi:hypothetical protein
MREAAETIDDFLMPDGEVEIERVAERREQADRPRLILLRLRMLER